jgi:phospholipase C
LTKRDAAARNVLALASLPAPRAAPASLPNPAAVPPQAAARADKSASANAGNVPAFLHAALRTDLQTSPPEQHPSILARVKSIQTLAEADQYFAELGQKLFGNATQRARK